MKNELTEHEKNINKIKEHLETCLEVVCDASSLTEDEYILVRRNSFGASDSSILCGVNLYKTKEQLIAEKRSQVITEDERSIGQKPAVRMGKELEPMVLTKFQESTGLDLLKPTEMYRHKEFPYLTINYDGVGIEQNAIITVEAKIVTKYGEKYYKKLTQYDKTKPVIYNKNNKMDMHILEMAAACGIPAYYYTQVQQQIMGLDKDSTKCTHGYLAVLFIDTWEFKYFYVPRDEYTISYIIAEGAKAAEKIK